MASKTHNLDPNLYQYLRDVSLREPQVLQELGAETAKLPRAIMQTSPEQGQFMYLLTKLIAAKNIIEVGVFTGYSTLYLALAVPDDGKIIACDVNEEWTSLGRRYWEKAGVDHKIELILAPAGNTLQGLLDAGKSNSFDMAFIDADKVNYDIYYELCLQLIRPGGLILVDNTMWEGKVIDPAITDPDTQAIRDLNSKLLHDERVDLSMLPIGDGLTLARKRG